MPNKEIEKISGEMSGKGIAAIMALSWLGGTGEGNGGCASCDQSATTPYYTQRRPSRRVKGLRHANPQQSDGRYFTTDDQRDGRGPRRAARGRNGDVVDD